MNKQRKVLITITYNEMGIIIDTKAEELGSSAQLGTDCISRQAAIMDAESWVAVDEYEKHMQKYVVEWLKEFPPAEPEIIECDPVKACNEATMNKLCSAYRYLSMLEDLKVYGYVLAKRRTK